MILRSFLDNAKLRQDSAVSDSPWSGFEFRDLKQGQDVLSRFTGTHKHLIRAFEEALQGIVNGI
jgi:hypothetical protein